MARHRLATFGLFIGLSLGAAVSAGADARPGARDTTWMTVGDDTLAAMRGGFDLGGGVMVSFGISRVVTVNGVVLSSTSFQLPDLGRITAAQIAAFERYLGSTSVVQVGSGNTAPTVTPTADGGASVASSSGSTGSPGSAGQAGTSGSSDTAGSATTTFSSPATVVQNTLNNQAIQTRTVIDATTNALSLARGANTAAALRDALTRAVPGR